MIYPIYMKPIVKTPFVSGLVLIIGGPVLGVLGTIISMVSSFGTLSSGTQDAEGLASEISSALVTTFLGIGLGVLGLLFLFIALIAHLITGESKPKAPTLDEMD